MRSSKAEGERCQFEKKKMNIELGSDARVNQKQIKKRKREEEEEEEKEKYIVSKNHWKNMELEVVEVQKRGDSGVINDAYVSPLLYII